MKKLIALTAVAFALTMSAAAFAGTDDSFQSGVYSKKFESASSYDDGKMLEKQKRKQKRKHTGLDDGPNHT